MGLFDAKECALCGNKAGMLTKQKLQDGFLCGDCKKQLSDLSSGWKQHTIADVKDHLQQREANKERSSQFQVTRSVGTGHSIELDDTHGWFRFNIGRDYKQGNAQVFGFNELGNFYVEVHYDQFADDSDGDGIPDQIDRDSDSFGGTSAAMSAMSGELNAQSANMFISQSGMTPYFRSVGNQVNDAGLPSEVTDITMVVGTTNRFWPEVRLRGSYFGRGGDMAKLQEAQQAVQALMQVKGQGGMAQPGMAPGMAQPGMAAGMMGGMQPGMMPNQMGMAQPGMTQPGMAPGMAQPGMGAPMQPGMMPNQMGMAQPVPPQGMPAQPQMAQPAPGGAPAQPSTCPNCNAPASGQFCTSCGTKLY